MATPFISTIASNQRTLFWVRAVLASLVLAVSALISVPMYPVPMYMFIPALVMLSLFSDTRFAFTATCLYLVEATIGLPVLSGGRIDPMWLLSPVGGYIVTFPLLAVIISSLSKRFGKQPFLAAAIAIFTAQCVLYTVGVANLTAYIGFKAALATGLYPFMLKALLTLILGSSLYKAYKNRAV